MRLRAVSAALLLLAGGVLAGCDARPGHAGSTVPIGQSSRALTVDGRHRTVRLYRPATLDSPAPLVVMLHGGFGSGGQAESAYGWDAEADAGHFLVAYPDGLDRAWSVGGGCCGVPGRTGVDDVRFITAVLDDIRRAVPVDPARVYATGVSNGGLLAYRLACDTTEFAAIGPDSATMLGDCPAPAPVSVIHIHGTADTRIPYDGGTGEGVAHIDGPSVPDLVATWRATDRCGPPTVTVAHPVATSTAPCDQGRAVELVTIEGAGHQWPGSTGHPAVDRLLGIDEPSTALSATGTIWRFFAAHPRPGG